MSQKPITSIQPLPCGKIRAFAGHRVTAQSFAIKLFQPRQGSSQRVLPSLQALSTGIPTPSYAATAPGTLQPLSQHFLGEVLGEFHSFPNDHPTPCTDPDTGSKVQGHEQHWMCGSPGGNP